MKRMKKFYAKIFYWEHGRDTIIVPLEDVMNELDGVNESEIKKITVCRMSDAQIDKVPEL